MPLKTYNLEWLNHNEQRNYPLAASADLQDQTGSFRIPENFILSLYLPVHSGLNTTSSRFFIKNIGAYATGYSVVVGYQPSSGSPVNVATALINREVHERYTTYNLGGVGDFSDTIGHIVVGRLDSADEQPAGFFTFDFENTRLEPDAIRPITRGISSIRIRSGSDVSEPIYGDIEIVAGENFQAVPILVAGQDPIIRFNAIEGEGLIEECICEGDATRDPIKAINGIGPNDAGNFTIQVDEECLEISTIANGIRIKDTCAAPCCSCEDLEKITEDLEKFGDQQTTLRNFLVRLQSSVSQFEAVVLGTRLSDRGCITCS